MKPVFQKFGKMPFLVCFEILSQIQVFYSGGPFRALHEPKIQLYLKFQ